MVLNKNQFFYQRTFKTIKYKDIWAEYVTSQTSKRVYNSSIDALNNDFLPKIKYFGYKVGIQFNNTPLVVEKNNYKQKIVNACIAYVLHNWSKVLLRIFTLKKCLFGATTTIKNCVEEKYVYSDYEIAFDGEVSWSFGNGYARNFIIFGADNSSSCHNVYYQGKEILLELMEKMVNQKKSLAIILLK